jgi:hypothetical protein
VTTYPHVVILDSDAQILHLNANTLVIDNEAEGFPWHSHRQDQVNHVAVLSRIKKVQVSTVSYS